MRKVFWVLLACLSINQSRGIHQASNPDTSKIDNIFELDSTIISKDHTDLAEGSQTKILLDDDEFNVLENQLQINKEKTEADFSVEEKQDQSEFIFIKGNQKLVLHDLLGQESNKVDSTTKVYLRVKRSDNVILEENLGTTLSGFRYTGRDAKLNNEVYFKNINS